jgi:DNA-binding transcriptional MerR regulator
VATSNAKVQIVSLELYTTVQVAKMTKIPRATLQHWIATRKIAAPRVKLLKGKAVRLWSQAQIEKARELKGTLKPGPKKKK